MNIYQGPPMARVRSLLEMAGLPYCDIDDKIENFFGCGSAENPGGVVGLELYGSDALLRSLAVSTEYQGRGCASALVTEAECFARENRVSRIYLLTETAKDFFERRGYHIVGRETAPEGIRNSLEFSVLCPASAIFMCKTLG